MIRQIKHLLTRSNTIIILLLIVLAVLFNIERLDFGKENLIDISSFVYFIGCIYVISVISIPKLQRIGGFSNIVICLVFYFFCKLVIFTKHPLSGGIYTYISIIEVLLLSILVILAYGFTYKLREFEEAFKKKLLIDVRIRSRSESSLETASEQVQTAMTLSRRHQYPLSVAVLEPVINQFRNAFNYSTKDGRPTDITLKLTEIINSILRSTDLLLKRSEYGQFTIVCQVTDLEGLTKLLDRIRDVAADNLGILIVYGTACFPGEALTFSDLFNLAESKLQNSKTNNSEDNNHNLQKKRDEHSNPLISEPSLSFLPNWINCINPEKRILRGLKYTITKRVMDVTLILVTLPIWFPILAICAFIIKLSSPHDYVFFSQYRIGKDGHTFRMYKFRTMFPNAEEQKKKYDELNELSWPDFKISGDPRVTRIGRFLRKTSLDELPELLNVLKGNMSLVGPRPTTFSPQTYTLWQTERLNIQPGITGLWQITGRGTLDFEDRVRLDIAYIEHRCLWVDVQILLRTIPAVLLQRGAS